MVESSSECFSRSGQPCSCAVAISSSRSVALPQLPQYILAASCQLPRTRLRAAFSNSSPTGAAGRQAGGLHFLISMPSGPRSGAGRPSICAGAGRRELCVDAVQSRRAAHDDRRGRVGYRTSSVTPSGLVRRRRERAAMETTRAFFLVHSCPELVRVVCSKRVYRGSFSLLWSQAKLLFNLLSSLAHLLAYHHSRRCSFPKSHPQQCTQQPTASLPACDPHYDKPSLPG